MDPEVLFQLTASTLASIFCGASLIFWLLSIDAMELARAEREITHLQSGCDRWFCILGIDRFYFSGTAGSEFKRAQVAYFSGRNFLANHNPDPSQRMLQLEVNTVLLLLILNEVRMAKANKSNTDLNQYLSESTLQHCLTHILSALLFVGSATILLLSMTFPVRSTKYFTIFI